MLSHSKRMFGEILLTEGVLQKEQLDAALETQSATGAPLGHVLLQEGLISESEIVRVLSIQYQLPFVRPSSYEIPADLMRVLPPKFMYQNRLVPLDRFGDTVLVGIGDIPPETVQRRLTEAFDCEVFYCFSPLSDIEGMLREQFTFTQDELVELDVLRSGSPRAVERQQITKPEGQAAIFQGLDQSSWESIFDEAEKNV